MDRQVPPPDEDDGIGRSKVARRSGCETPRRVPPRPSCTMHPRGLSVRADMGPDRKALPRIARPQPGGEWEKFVPGLGELREDECRQRRPAAPAVFNSRVPERRSETAKVPPAPPARPRRTLRQGADDRLRIADAGSNHPPPPFGSAGPSPRNDTAPPLGLLVGLWVWDFPYSPDTAPLNRCPWRPRHCPGTPESWFSAMCRLPPSRY